MCVFERIFSGSCDETREHLSERLESELSGWRRIRVLRHLSHCDRCHDVLDSLARTVDLLRSLGGNERLAPSIADAIVIRIRLEESGG